MSTTRLQKAAIVLAACLLGLQVTAAIEYSWGGSLYTQASLVATMITLAVLPMFIETARQSGAYGIMAALFVAFVAFLAYSLPATVGRTGEVREAKVVEAKVSTTTKNLLERELSTAQSRLADAYQEVVRECRTGFGSKCVGWRQAVAERQSRVDQLTAELVSAKPKSGDLGSEAWAWALTAFAIPADAIRKVSVLAFGAGLDVVIWALMWFATSHKVAGRQPVTIEAKPKPLLLTHDPVVSALKAAGRPLTNDELAARMGVHKGTASKLVSAHPSIKKVRQGREVAISLLN